MANLPHDIIVNILTRLPVKSLCQFRCVCKLWRTLISSSHFVKLHLSRSNSTYHRIVFASDYFYSVNYQDPYADGSLVARKLTIPPARGCIKLYELLGSCNGLLLVTNDFETFLINPITRESENIPNSPFGFNLGSNIYGLGFDCSIDDFKVVRISYSVDKDVVSEYIVSVYTLSTGYWRRIKNSPYDHCCSFPSPAVLANGALHCFAVKKTAMDSFGVIACFDIVEEVFRDILPPNRIECSQVMQYDVGVLGGCLCMIVYHNTERYDLWVMKEYGTRDSWNKFTIVLSCAFATLKPLCFLENGEVLLDITQWVLDANYYVNNKKFVTYNLNEETYRDVVIDGIQGYVGSGTYVESLISPNHNNRV